MFFFSYAFSNVIYFKFFSVFDASVKFPNGVLYGSTYDFGNFDECMQVHSERNNIKGKYCLARIRIFPDTLSASSTSVPDMATLTATSVSPPTSTTPVYGDAAAGQNESAWRKIEVCSLLRKMKEKNWNVSFRWSLKILQNCDVMKSTGPSAFRPRANLRTWLRTSKTHFLFILSSTDSWRA